MATPETSPPPEASDQPATDRALADAETGRQHARRLRNSILSLIVLFVLVGALLLAVPGLAGVERDLRDARAGWIAAAIALEVLSCVGYVLIFQSIFYRAPRIFAARLAWSELAFGAAVSLGGAGGVALGVWVLRSVGAPTGRVAERSAVLFLATSAVNVIVLVVSGALLALGISPGSGSVLLGLVPGGVGLVVLAFFLALPRWSERMAERLRGRERVASGLRGLAEAIRHTEEVVFTRPDWRLLGAFAYLLFDIAVLWACFKALGYSPPIVAVALAYQIGYLANLIPIPGGIGALDAGLVGALVLYGITAVPSTAAVIAYHAIVLWVPTAIGTVAFVLLRRMLRNPEALRPRPERAR